MDKGILITLLKRAADGVVLNKKVNLFEKRRTKYAEPEVMQRRQPEKEAGQGHRARRLHRQLRGQERGIANVQPHYRTDNRPELEIQRDIYSRTLRVMDKIHRTLPLWRVEMRHGYLTALWSLRKRLQSHEFERMCDLLPLHKIHKTSHSWRAILRLHLPPRCEKNKTHIG